MEEISVVLQESTEETQNSLTQQNGSSSQNPYSPYDDDDSFGIEDFFNYFGYGN